MKLKAWSFALLCLAAPLAAAEPSPVEAAAPAAAVTPAPDPAAWASKVKLGGFMKVWYVAADNASKDYRAGSASVKNLRLKVDVKPGEDVNVVVMPEFAGQAAYDVTLLDAYIALKRGPVTLTGGQFTVPYGQDITTSPAKLWSVDNAIHFAAVRGGKNRDQGVMLSGTRGPAKLSLAAVQGKGLNVASANGYITDRNDYAGRLELSAPGGLVASGAFYSGWNVSAVPVTWSEAALRCDKSPLLPALFWKAEWLNRPDTGRWGIAGNIGLKTGPYRTVLVYERVEDPLHALGQTNFGGGVTRDMGSGLSLTVQSFGLASGPSVSPTTGRTVVQLLAEF